MSIGAIGLGVMLAREAREKEIKKRNLELKCKKCSSVNSEWAWYEHGDHCPHCGAMKYSTIWTGEHPNFIIRREKVKS